MSTVKNYIAITSEPIQVHELIDCYTSEESGGEVIFLGRVRNKNEGKKVSHLIYEAHQTMAEKMIEKIVAEAIEEFGLKKAICMHRIGRLEIGEVAVVILTLAVHRKEAYRANEAILLRVKSEAPIWKQEFYSDASVEWK